MALVVNVYLQNVYTLKKMNSKDMAEFNILPKQILTNYKYENNHICPCMFDFKMKEVWNNKWVACYIN